MAISLGMLLWLHVWCPHTDIIVQMMINGENLGKDLFIGSGFSRITSDGGI